MQAVPPAPQAVGDLVAGDAVTAALVRCGVAPATAQHSVQAAMSVVTGSGSGSAASDTGAAMPLYDSGDAAPAAAAAAPATSRGFGQLFAQHVMSPAAMVNSGPPAVQALRQVQGLLVQDNMHALAAHLFATLVDRRGGDGAAADGAADGAAMVAFGAANPERRRRMCALAAHMLLALEALGVLPRSMSPGDDRPEAMEVRRCGLGHAAPHGTILTELNPEGSEDAVNGICTPTDVCSGRGPSRASAVVPCV